MRDTTTPRVSTAGLRLESRGMGAVIAMTLVVLVLSFILGVTTSYAQGFLPDALRSFANSPSGWTILTAVLVAVARPGLAWGAVLGLGSFVILVLGYTAASHWRGLTFDPVFWSMVGVLAGPLVGAAAAGVVGRRPQAAALGSAVLAAVLLTDAGYGLTTIADTTSPVYWIVAAALGVA
ncbi:MAG: DUF6518 family protein, partial [Nocardioidaceae bacterium]